VAGLLLTDKQRAALAAFRRLSRRDGLPPTIGEVGEAVGLASVFNAKPLLDALVDKGLLERVGAGSRAYRLPDGETPGRLPLCGLVAAGRPIPSDPEVREWIDVRAEFGEDAFLLEVQGDSMRDAGIITGDFVAVVKRAAADGDTVVCRLGGDTYTLKVFADLGRRGTWLYPRNAEHEPIKLTPELEPFVEGVYVGMFRSERRRVKAALKRRTRP
jgi:repressor LexA